MPADLRLVKNLPQLLKYLRDELLWPIETDDAEEITFEYAPADFAALAPDHHVQIEKILQLRPLVTGQPWGIFYVQFKKARLPVVVLRELLASLVFKKRQSANKSERPAWECHDLLFISSYGEDAEHRHLNFAHFSDQPNGSHLPALRVLDWEEADTDRALARLDSTLHEKLRWPADDTNLDLWREQWSAAFRRGLRHPIKKAEQLAHALAVLAQNIRASVLAQMAVESERGKLRTLHAAFRSALIQDLEPKQFADMFAQTIAYGLFTNATRRTTAGNGRGATAITADGAVDSVTSLSPFLRDLLDEFLSVGGRRRGGLDYDKLGVNEVVDLLNADTTDLAAVLDDFGHKKRDEDPVIHFYETFLAAYDKAEKVKRGVFYTPQPVVSYIVRSVHELLQTEFGLPHGLASTETWGEMLKKLPGLSLPNLSDDQDPARARPLPATEFFVQVLDPATGTATFLVETIDVIHRHLRAAWDAKGGLGAMPEIHAKPAGKPAPKTFAEFWNLYVPTSLLPRLYGYELMMAPYAIAHMKIALKLADTGFTAWKDLGTNDRVHIYLTNALEPAAKQLGLIGFEALAHEAEAVNCIKREKRFTSVIGNPPYAGYSANDGEWIEQQMERYKVTVRGEERQIQRLSNDYVKFIRFSESILTESKIGCFGFITDSGFLNGILFRDMRTSILGTFQNAWIYNLHGVAMRGVERESGADDNVFDITQGVAISIFTRIGTGPTHMHYADLIGSRNQKYITLAQSSAKKTNWARLTPTKSKWLFIPSSADHDYETWPLFTELIGSGSPKSDRDSRYGTGVKTRYDEFAIGWTPDDAVKRIKQIANRDESDADLIKNLGLCTTAHFSIGDARKRAEAKDLLKHVKSITYRPFDSRSLVYLREFICEPKTETMGHMTNPKNLAMAVLRRDRKENGAGFFVARGLIAKDLVSNLDDALVWPLYIIQADDELLGKSISDELIGEPNISRKAIVGFTTSLGLKYQEQGSNDSALVVSPETIFHYIYSVLHSPTYRTRYAEFLKIDFPRIPLPGSRALFDALAPLGEQLVALHLLESPLIAKPRTKFIGSAKTVIEKVSYADGTVFIDKAQTTGFSGVPEAVFEFHIGGYQVCEKWLKDRKGRTLSADDVAHYHQIVIALQETIRLMAEIDTVIETHGGFPAAFASAAPAPGPDAAKSAPNPAADLGLQTEDELPLA